MTTKTVPQLDAAGTLTGAELLPVSAASGILTKATLAEVVAAGGGIDPDVSTYTPEWKAATTDPDIKSGQLRGWYRRLGAGLAWVRIQITMGADTTYGVGDWTLSLPAGWTTSDEFQQLDGSAYRWTSGPTRYPVAWLFGFTGSNVAWIQASGTAQQCDSAVPFTWATNDVLSVSGILAVNVP